MRAEPKCPQKLLQLAKWAGGRAGRRRGGKSKVLSSSKNCSRQTEKVTEGRGEVKWANE